MQVKRSTKGVQFTLSNEQADMLALVLEAYEYMPIHRIVSSESSRMAHELRTMLKESKD